VILLQLKLTRLKLDVLSLTFSTKKKDMNTDKLAINWQSLAWVRFQLKFAFITQSKNFSYRSFFECFSMNSKLQVVQFLRMKEMLDFVE